MPVRQAVLEFTGAAPHDLPGRQQAGSRQGAVDQDSLTCVGKDRALCDGSEQLVFGKGPECRVRSGWPGAHDSRGSCVSGDI